MFRFRAAKRPRRPSRAVRSNARRKPVGEEFKRKKKKREKREFRARKPIRRRRSRRFYVLEKERRERNIKSAVPEDVRPLSKGFRAHFTVDVL